MSKAEEMALEKHLNEALEHMAQLSDMVLDTKSYTPHTMSIELENVRRFLERYAPGKYPTTHRCLELFLGYRNS